MAQVAEVSLRPDGLPKVERVVCAVDCGVAVNPDVVRAQMEGGIGFGLGAALWSEITLEKGRVVAVELRRLPHLAHRRDAEGRGAHRAFGAKRPSGVGEPGVSPIGPAVANAFAKLTGRRVRKLPFVRGLEASKA